MRIKNLDSETPVRELARSNGFDPESGEFLACEWGFVIRFTNPQGHQMVVSCPGHLGKVIFLDPGERPDYVDGEVERLGGLET